MGTTSNLTHVIYFDEKIKEILFTMEEDYNKFNGVFVFFSLFDGCTNNLKSSGSKNSNGQVNPKEISRDFSL